MQTALFKRTAVLIEQNPVQSCLYRDVLGAGGFEVYATKSAIEGLIKIKENFYDLAVINMEIAEESFIEKLLRKIKMEKTTEHMPIIGLSIYNNRENMQKNLDELLTKPISIDRFVESVFRCIEKKRNDCQDSNN